jgi:hypothetical protein
MATLLRDYLLSDYLGHLDARSIKALACTDKGAAEILVGSVFLLRLRLLLLLHHCACIGALSLTVCHTGTSDIGSSAWSQ